MTANRYDDPELTEYVITLEDGLVLEISDFEKAEFEGMKSSNWYRLQLASMMTNSEVGTILTDKLQEKKELEREYFNALAKNINKDSNIYIEGFYEKLIKEIETAIITLRLTLKERNPNSGESANLKIQVEEAKLKVRIEDVIQSLGGIRIRNINRNIKCPLPDHRDNTASFKIYPRTNSWYCYGCKKGGDHVHFIEYLTGCTRAQAMKNFISISK